MCSGLGSWSLRQIQGDARLLGSIVDGRPNYRPAIRPSLTGRGNNGRGSLNWIWVSPDPPWSVGTWNRSVLRGVWSSISMPARSSDLSVTPNRRHQQRYADNADATWEGR